jgi:hypothetical protein
VGLYKNEIWETSEKISLISEILENLGNFAIGGPKIGGQKIGSFQNEAVSEKHVHCTGSLTVEYPALGRS